MDHVATHTFDAPIEEVWAMFINPDAHIAKFDSMGHRDIELLETKTDGGDFMIKLQRIIEVELPGFAKKVLSPANTVISTDNWHTNDDGSHQGTWVLDTIGAPVDIKGTTRLEPDGDQTNYTIAFELKVNVPFIGGKIANWARGDAEKQVQAEFAAGDAWLATH